MVTMLNEDAVAEVHVAAATLASDAVVQGLACTHGRWFLTVTYDQL